MLCEQMREAEMERMHRYTKEKEKKIKLKSSKLLRKSKSISSMTNTKLYQLQLIKAN